MHLLDIKEPKKSILIRTYSELNRLDSHIERFRYLQLRGRVGEVTFGYDRFLNQKFYRSHEWKSIRHHVITRDGGNDLGVDGFTIYDKILIHHMNPLTPEDLDRGHSDIIDPEFLISVTHNTHNAIHYGDESLLPTEYVERKPGDTNLW